MKTSYLISLIVLALSLFSVVGISQTDFYNEGQMITILGGTELYIKGSYISDKDGNTGTQVFSEGTIRLTGDMINLDANNLFSSDSGKVIFAGSSIQYIRGDSSIHFHNLEIDNPNFDVVVMNNIQLSDSILFTTGNLRLESGNLDLTNSGRLINESENSRVYGNGDILLYSANGGNDTVSSIGLELPGYVYAFNVVRGHQSQPNAGDGGIQRYYKIVPEKENIDTIRFSYFDSELNGLDESKLDFWLSYNEMEWRRQYVVPIANQLRKDFAPTTDSLSYIITASEGECSNPPVLNLDADTIYMCGGDSVLLDMNVGSGMKYEWSNGATTEYFKTDLPGLYWGE
ncbi:MAG: hypothetical protein IH948_06340, partial [Bacteroidetes bacterium]|nr:hypothetical protein [Bacteroidota bacterium]